MGRQSQRQPSQRGTSTAPATAETLCVSSKPQVQSAARTYQPLTARRPARQSGASRRAPGQGHRAQQPDQQGQPGHLGDGPPQEEVGGQGVGGVGNRTGSDKGRRAVAPQRPAQGVRPRHQDRRGESPGHLVRGAQTGRRQDGQRGQDVVGGRGVEDEGGVAVAPVEVGRPAREALPAGQELGQAVGLGQVLVAVQEAPHVQAGVQERGPGRQGERQGQQEPRRPGRQAEVCVPHPHHRETAGPGGRPPLRLPPGKPGKPRQGPRAPPAGRAQARTRPD